MEKTYDKSGEFTTAQHTSTLHLPAPTAWPMVLALGISLIFTAMVTHWVIGLLGLMLLVPAIIGWFQNVLPSERVVLVPVSAEIVPVYSLRLAHAPLPHGTNHRKLLPVETFSVATGIKGGIAGGVAMVIPAAVYGIVRYHSIWYAANLLAAGGFVGWTAQTDAFLAQFHWQGLLAASAIHATASVLIGLLYGAMLPMYPRKPILTAGFVAPFLWTGLLYSALGVISPILNQRINWLWFVLSQIFFGLVAGFVVNLHVKVRTPQFQQLPFAVRAGLHINAESDEDQAL